VRTTVGIDQGQIPAIGDQLTGICP
jgi:hypothetical protein